jgi:hypothetical protein
VAGSNLSAKYCSIIYPPPLPTAPLACTTQGGTLATIMTPADFLPLLSPSRLLSSSTRRFWALLGLFLIAGSLFFQWSKISSVLINSMPYSIGKSLNGSVPYTHGSDPHIAPSKTVQINPVSSSEPWPDIVTDPIDYKNPLCETKSLFYG